MPTRLADKAWQSAEGKAGVKCAAHLMRSPPAMFESATSDQTGGFDATERRSRTGTVMLTVSAGRRGQEAGRHCPVHACIHRSANGTRAANTKLQLRTLAPELPDCQLSFSVCSTSEGLCKISCRGRRLPIGKQRSGKKSLRMELKQLDALAGQSRQC